VDVREHNPKETEKMNYEMYMIGTAILVLLGLAKSTRKTPRFERRERTERDGVIINWLTVKIGTVLKIDVTDFIVARAKDIAAAGYMVPERFLEDNDGNNVGAIINVAREVKGAYPWKQALLCQLTLVEALQDVADGFATLDQVTFSAESLNTTGDSDKWTFDTAVRVHITHEKTGDGNRSAYGAFAPALPDAEQLQILDFADKSEENIGGTD